MMVRFAFAVMVQADADIMLIDEVLAVGDAAFAQKCMDVFREKRRAGKTIVLVTHDMTTVQTLCHRAMLLHDGELRYIGEPEDAALRYYRMNFARPRPSRRSRSRARRSSTSTRGWSARSCAARRARRSRTLARGRADRARRRARGRPARSTRPSFIFHVRNDDGQVVFELHAPARASASTPGGGCGWPGTVENPLVAGRYSLDVYIREDGRAGRHDRAGPAAAALRRRRDRRRPHGIVCGAQPTSSRCWRRAE